MIDWVSCFLPCLHQPIPSDKILKITPDGTVEYEKRLLKEIEGSHDSNIRIASEGSDGKGNATEIYFTGNPSKFLQGHNVFGSDDLLSLVLDSFKVICEYAEINPTADDLTKIMLGQYRLTRVDVNESFELQSLSDVVAWLNTASVTSNSRHGHATKKGTTVYWGKTSKRWGFKGYPKGLELDVPKHKLPIELLETPLHEWAQNKLRMELTLRTKELEKIGLRYAKDWNLETPKKIFNDYIVRVKMNEQMALTDKQVHQLPQALKSTYLLWQQGFNVRDHVPQRSFYRHKKQLIDGFGIDITLPKQSTQTTNIVPLIRVLEAKPATIPDWAFDLNLIHHSAA